MDLSCSGDSFSATACRWLMFSTPLWVIWTTVLRAELCVRLSRKLLRNNARHPVRYHPDQLFVYSVDDSWISEDWFAFSLDERQWIFSSEIMADTDAVSKHPEDENKRSNSYSRIQRIRRIAKTDSDRGSKASARRGVRPHYFRIILIALTADNLLI